MTDRRPVIWPWIIGLMLIAVLIWALVEVATVRGERTADSPQPLTNIPTPLSI